MRLFIVLIYFLPFSSKAQNFSFYKDSAVFSSVKVYVDAQKKYDLILKNKKTELDSVYYRKMEKYYFYESKMNQSNPENTSNTSLVFKEDELKEFEALKNFLENPDLFPIYDSINRNTYLSLIAPIKDKIKNKIDQYCQENKISVLYNLDELPSYIKYHDKEADITDKLIKYLRDFKF
ncbi:MAG: OmpH family outer membrane protein [Chitinophagales bacterium]|jgi:hypothetical protein|nr:OmpH family outer membrane protein [Chitinophagales bacterium]